MKIKVSELIVRYMERLGVEHVFGIPGAHILPVYDSLYDSPIHTVLTKHEQGAAFMACGYARVSGRIAACIATAGPGATNLVTGIANAFADRLPVLVIAGETPTYIFGRGGLQEGSGEGGSIGQSELFRPITRYARCVERTDYLAQVLNQATKALLAPDAGPVLISIPFNVQKEEVDAAILDGLPASGQIHKARQCTAQAREVAQLIMAARYPVMIAGHGCIRSGAQRLVAQLSRRMNIAVATSLKGKCVMDERDDLSLGTLGVTSNGQAYQYLTEKADLILFLGAGFNERTSYLWDERLLAGKRLVQIDHDRSQLDKVFRSDLAILGDVGEVLAEVLEHLEALGTLSPSPTLPPEGEGVGAGFKPAPTADDFQGNGNAKATRDDIRALRSSAGSDYAIFQSGFSLPEQFFAKLEEQFSGDCLIFDDNIIFAQNFYKASTGAGYYPNSGISSLGHALPAAIGAGFCQERPIFASRDGGEGRELGAASFTSRDGGEGRELGAASFAILGDGGFQMCCMEIMTAVNYGKPLNIVLFNNGTMGLIRKNQHQQYRQRFIDCDFVNPDYRLLAQSFGIQHKRVACEADLDELFATHDLRGAINLIEIMIDKDAFPNYSSKR
ncbi:MAG: acetolactate synthase [Gammaproteobacteria bacterium RIFOXYA12_FULL_61_12]|nr:MAG: acetolactate synthase [Gammaproteobacteria bacterium RIFOXYD12_FULL_61_37]OGT90208.1 MAG: acetolactate synthase [Gammaproteobacteria bacterium RIFOXYA12_FULL_61_12]